MNQQHMIILTGPTASGKSELSLKLAKEFDCEIINADMGQFYAPLSVGVAKPAWEKSEIPHHLFDYLTTATDLDVAKYRQLVIQKMKQVWKKNKTPLLVGGSLFYLKSIVFPPSKFEMKTFLYKPVEGKTPWEQLNSIDPQRASELHPNDLYRIGRALEIWHQTGIKPSAYKPIYLPPCPVVWMFLSPETEVLKKRISYRTAQMLAPSLSNNWIEEVERLINTDWEEFLVSKKLIGYPEVIDWVKKGKPKYEFRNLISEVERKTWGYARRQITFWNKLERDLHQGSSSVEELPCITMKVGQSLDEESAFQDLCEQLSNNIASLFS